MEALKKLVEEHKAKIRPPVDTGSILTLETKLGFKLSAEYKDYLATFGIIAFKSNETYGLGVPEDYYLNVLNKYSDLSQDTSYPESAVPLLEIGDGQYYLYKNDTKKILHWATPNGGVVRTLDEALEPFLIKHLFE
jgi:hypothetical protein